MVDIAPKIGPSATAVPNKTESLRQAAQKLEASFLSEMLKSAKFGEPRKSFGGGVGEEHFASFLRTEVAQKMAATGGIGLAEHLFLALKEKAANDQG